MGQQSSLYSTGSSSFFVFLFVQRKISRCRQGSPRKFDSSPGLDPRASLGGVVCRRRCRSGGGRSNGYAPGAWGRRSGGSGCIGGGEQSSLGEGQMPRVSERRKRRTTRREGANGEERGKRRESDRSRASLLNPSLFVGGRFFLRTDIKNASFGERLRGRVTIF